MLQGQHLKSSCLVAVASSILNNALKGIADISVVLEEAEKLPEEEWYAAMGLSLVGIAVGAHLWRELK